MPSAGGVSGGDERRGGCGDGGCGGERAPRVRDEEGWDGSVRNGDGADEGPEEPVVAAAHVGAVAADVVAAGGADAEAQADQGHDGQYVQQAEPTVAQVTDGEGAGRDEGHAGDPAPARRAVGGVALRPQKHVTAEPQADQ